MYVLCFYFHVRLDMHNTYKHAYIIYYCIVFVCVCKFIFITATVCSYLPVILISSIDNYLRIHFSLDWLSLTCVKWGKLRKAVKETEENFNKQIAVNWMSYELKRSMLWFIKMNMARQNWNKADGWFLKFRAMIQLLK